MELVKVENNQIAIANELLTKMKLLHEEAMKLQVEEDKLKQALLEAMKNNDIKKIENDVFTASYTAPSTRKSVDTKKLKDEGVYEYYLKETPVKASIKLSYK